MTFVASAGRRDLVVPLKVPLNHLIPEVVAEAVPADRRARNARWVIGSPGGLPFLPDQTLGDNGVLDGALLYLVDAYSAPPGVLSGLVGAVPFDGLLDPAAPQPRASIEILDEEPRLRWGLEPTIPIFGPPLVATLAGAWWLFFQGPEIVGMWSALAGGVLLVLVALFAWWIGIVGLISGKPYPGYQAPETVADTAAAPVAAAGGQRVPTDKAPEMGGAHGFWSESDRTARVNHLVEEFIYDLGRAVAGVDPAMTYADPAAAQAIADWVRPLRDGKVMMAPDFGGWVDVGIDWGDPPRRPVGARAVITDASKRIDDAGAAIPGPSRQVVVSVTFDAFLSTIRTASIRPQ